MSNIDNSRYGGYERALVACIQTLLLSASAEWVDPQHIAELLIECYDEKNLLSFKETTENPNNLPWSILWQ